MKDIINVINEEKVNEAGIFSAFDITLVSMIASTIGFLTSIGVGVTGQMVRSIIGARNRDKHGKEKVKLLQDLKNFSRSIEADLSNNQAVMSVLNSPGEWTTEMCAELRNAVYDQLSDEQKKEYDRLESEYIKERNKFVKF